MVRRVFTVFCLGAMAMLLMSCGQTYELQSISVAPTSPNIEGVGSTQSLVVTAHYSNTKSLDVTAKSVFELGASADPLAPLDAVTLSKSGVLQSVISPTTGVAACTWHATPTNTGDTLFNYTTNPYSVTVTYAGFTAVAYASVDAIGSCYDGIGFVAPSGFAGN
jgi:hypothetical protein